MDQAASSPNTPHPIDRRRYLRQRPASIIYVKLDSLNGGIILDLGLGGLAFQAAGKLIAKQDLTLKFRLGETGPSVEVVGGIAWMAPTQKEAGVHFKSLSSNAHQEITQWMAKQKNVHGAVAGVSPAPSPRTIFSRSVPALPHLATQAAGTRPEVGSPKPVSEIRPDAPAGKPRSFVFPEPTKTTTASKELGKDVDTPKVKDGEKIPKRQWVLPESLPSPRKDPAAEGPLSPALIMARIQQDRRLRKIVLIGSAGCLAILVLFLGVAYFSGSRDSGSLQQVPGVPANSPSSGSSHAPIPPPHASVRPRSGSLWTAFLRELFPGYGDNEKPGLSQEEANVSVWVTTRNGYYYCNGSPEYGTVQPGVLMMQGEALQNGYQPKLGDFCN